MPRRMALGLRSRCSQMRRNENVHLRSLLRSQRSVSRRICLPFDLFGIPRLLHTAMASSRTAAIRRCSPVHTALRCKRVKYCTGRTMCGSNRPGSFSSTASVSRFIRRPPSGGLTMQPACHGRLGSKLGRISGGFQAADPVGPPHFYNRVAAARRALTRRRGRCKKIVPRTPCPSTITSSMPFDEDVGTGRMRSLARLARPTAHEVRGALSAINIKLELLGRTLAADEAAVRQHLPGLKEQCRRIERLTDAFLTLAALPEAPTDADAGTVVSVVVEAVRPLAAVSRVALESVPIAPRLCSGPGIEACRQRLLDVLIEAVANATAGSVIHVDPVAGGGAVCVRDAAGACTDVALPTVENHPDA